MKTIFLVLLMICAFFGTASADEGDGVVSPNAPPDSFYAVMEDYFKVSEDQIKTCQPMNISEEEIPVVFFITQRAGVDPQAAVIVRSSGLSWMQVADHFHLNPRIFFVPLPANGASNGPYEKGYGTYKSRKNRINLSDADIINWVNLKFLSEYYGYDPQEIIQMRSAGKSFRTINSYYADKKEEVKWDLEEPHEEEPTPLAKDKTDKAFEQFGNMNHGMGGSPAP